MLVALMFAEWQARPITAPHAVVKGLGVGLMGSMYVSRAQAIPTNIRVEQLTLAEVQVRLYGEVSPPIDKSALEKIIPENLIPPNPDLNQKYWFVSMDGVWRITGGFLSPEGIRDSPPVHHLFVCFDVETALEQTVSARP